MKRSLINSSIDQAKAFLEAYGFPLPPFADWTPAFWQGVGHEYDELRDNFLGWDVTDFGKGDFAAFGLLLFTLRNGNQHLSKYEKTYAEKVMLVREGQKTPFHYHMSKMEDIINRGGGKLMLQLYNAAPDDGFADTPVAFVSDGKTEMLPAGAIVTLHSGESITITRGLYHSFWAESGAGTVLAVEVSACNDDQTDNYFYEPIPRFPTIEEDEPPRYLLACEYPKARG